MTHVPIPTDGAPPTGGRPEPVWRSRDAGADDHGDILTSRSLLDRVLAARGLDDPDRARAFLDPRLDQLHDPGLIPDLDRAAERILAAVRDGEPVAVFGDYDVDGLTATAILVRTVRTLAPTATVLTHIPHRMNDGYGLNDAALQQLADRGARVIVTVDCGITARHEAATASGLGVDLIITDHHNPPASVDDLPPAFAVVHPGRPDSAYPFAGLCGAGVAFKLAWRLATLACGSERVSDALREQLLDLLGLAAMGTIADVVPLLDENRAICRRGLPMLERGSVVGVRALIESAGLTGSAIDAGRVGFALAPRLNATGRLGDASEALDLLLTDNPDTAASIARRLSDTNTRRREIERRVTDEADAQAVELGMTAPDARSIVLRSPHWHPGVVGIACSRLVDRYHRPVLLCCEREGLLQGSGRSIPGLSVHGALEGCADLLTRFGGHDMACGFKLQTERFDAFVERFDARIAEQGGPTTPRPVVEYDCRATIDEVSASATREFDKLGPFGRDNPRVRVRLDNVRISTDPVPLGARGAHAALHVADENGRSLRVIGWNKADRMLTLRRGQSVDLVVCPKLSSWQGRERVEPEVHDLRLSTAGAATTGE